MEGTKTIKAQRILWVAFRVFCKLFSNSRSLPFCMLSRQLDNVNDVNNVNHVYTW